jgi:hypothetical protein
LAIVKGDNKGLKKARKRQADISGKMMKAGLIGVPRHGLAHFLGQTGADLTNAGIYAPYGIYEAGKAGYLDVDQLNRGQLPTHTAGLAAAMAKSTATDLRHPLRHPGLTLLDALAVASAGAGSVARVGAAGSAFRAAGEAGIAERAAAAGSELAAPAVEDVGKQYRHPPGHPKAGKFGKRPPLAQMVEDDFRKNREYNGLKAQLRAQEQAPPTPFGARAKAALTRPGHEGGSLLHLPVARETPLYWKGHVADNQLQMGADSAFVPGKGHVVAHRLEPDNPLLRPVHAWHAKQIQRHLDDLADGKKPQGKLADTAINLMGGAQKIVGREARASKRILGDTHEVPLPEGWIPSDAAPPPGEMARVGKAVNRPFRVFGVYLAPKYIATNLTGNYTMGVATQGVAKASANMLRARRMVETHGQQLTHDIENEVGISRTESTVPGSELEALKHDAEAPAGTAREKYRRFEQKAVHGVMAITDKDFRRASWLYRARERGFKTPEQQHDLIHSPKRTREREVIARKARKDAVDFNSLTPKEKQWVEGVYFYPWLSRATAWTGRTVANRPIKSAALAALSQQGQAASARDIGDQPEWSRGYIKTPWGFVNPKSVFTPSTPADVAIQARHPVKNLFARPGASIQPGSSFAEEFGTPAAGIATGQSLADLGAQLAPVGLLNRLGHPPPIIGKSPGKTFSDTGLKEGFGPFLFGGLYPRKGKTQVMHDQAARERFREASPMRRLSIKTDERKQKIPLQVAALKKRKIPVDKALVAAYKGDLDAYQHREEFKLKYATDRGATSYRSLPPDNKIEAALAYLRDHSPLSDESIRQMGDTVKYLSSDADKDSYANSLWSAANIGQYRSAWDSLVRTLPKHTKKLK